MLLFLFSFTLITLTGDDQTTPAVMEIKASTTPKFILLYDSTDCTAHTLLYSSLVSAVSTRAVTATLITITLFTAEAVILFVPASEYFIAGEGVAELAVFVGHNEDIA